MSIPDHLLDIIENDSRWEPDGTLGNDPAFAQAEQEDPDLDKALGLEMITFKLPTELAADLRALSRLSGLVIPAVIRAALQAAVQEAKVSMRTPIGLQKFAVELELTPVDVDRAFTATGTMTFMNLLKD